ncbi:MAG: hypothetical protein ABSE76_01850 [Minisyncoccia bacterium]|jgi:hypothetical protein
MKLLKKVPPIEVKRAFVISDYVSHQKYSRQQIGVISQAQYQKRVTKAKEIILQLPETMLDMILAGEYRKRFTAYNNADWHLAVADTDELGVWRGAGGLPTQWTHGNLAQTAEHVSEALDKNPKKLKHRSFTAIPGIIKTSLSVIQKEKYLLPIAFKGGTGTKGRRGLKIKVAGDLDDGCMRSVALAVSGKKKIKLYFGIPKKKGK